MLPCQKPDFGHKPWNRRIPVAGCYFILLRDASRTVSSLRPLAIGGELFAGQLVSGPAGALARAGAVTLTETAAALFQFSAGGRAPPAIVAHQRCLLEPLFSYSSCLRVEGTCVAVGGRIPHPRVALPLPGLGFRFKGFQSFGFRILDFGFRALWCRVSVSSQLTHRRCPPGRGGGVVPE